MTNFNPFHKYDPELAEYEAEKREERKTYSFAILGTLLLNFLIIGGGVFLSQKLFPQHNGLVALRHSNKQPTSEIQAANETISYTLPDTWISIPSKQNDVKVAFTTKEAKAQAENDLDEIYDGKKDTAGAIRIVVNNNDLDLETYDNLSNKKSGFDGVIIARKEMNSIPYRCVQNKDKSNIIISCVSSVAGKNVLYSITTTKAAYDADLAALEKVISTTKTISE